MHLDEHVGLRVVAHFELARRAVEHEVTQPQRAEVRLLGHGAAERDERRSESSAKQSGEPVRIDFAYELQALLFAVGALARAYLDLQLVHPPGEQMPARGVPVRIRLSRSAQVIE